MGFGLGRSCKTEQLGNKSTYLLFIRDKKKTYEAGLPAN